MPLLLTLFNIYIGQPKEIRLTLHENKIGIHVSREIISFKKFVVNIVIIANNEHESEKIIEKIAICFQKYH
jgi:hypothetical protein